MYTVNGRGCTPSPRMGSQNEMKRRKSFVVADEGKELLHHECGNEILCFNYSCPRFAGVLDGYLAALS